MPLLNRLLRAGETKLVKRLGALADHIETLEPDVQALSDEQLAGQDRRAPQASPEDGESLDELLSEAFAVVREAAVRTIGQRHFKVQLQGGAALHMGNIAEMKTGEGKTLTSVLPAYLNALAGNGVHLVTVNDYLARRDAENMGRIHRFLGLDGRRDPVRDAAGDPAHAVRLRHHLRHQQRVRLRLPARQHGLERRRPGAARAQLRASSTRPTPSSIDEARTPLIISGPAEQSARWYQEFARMAPMITRDVHYEVDERKRTVGVTDEGVR